MSAMRCKRWITSASALEISWHLQGSVAFSSRSSMPSRHRLGKALGSSTAKLLASLKWHVGKAVRLGTPEHRYPCNVKTKQNALPHLFNLYQLFREFVFQLLGSTINLLHHQNHQTSHMSLAPHRGAPGTVHRPCSRRKIGPPTGGSGSHNAAEVQTLQTMFESFLLSSLDSLVGAIKNVKIF